MKPWLLVVAPMIALVGTLAWAQGPMNQPIQSPYGPAPAVAVPANPPVAVQQPPVVVAPPPLAPPSPGTTVVYPAAGGQNTTIVVPQGSTVTVLSNGLRQEVQHFAAQGNVRTFDSWSGRVTLQNGPAVTFPQNFAFTQIPEVGQSAKLTYFVDQNGNNIGQSFDGATGR
jgi:hypothetical protein